MNCLTPSYATVGLVVVRDVDSRNLGCSACGHCNWQACLNDLLKSDIDEDGIFYPEIMEDLETNVVEDENETESEILQQPQEKIGEDEEN